MAHGDWSPDPDIVSERSEIVSEGWNVVPDLGAIAVAAAAQVEGRRRVRGLEVFELRLEEREVTTPAVDERGRFDDGISISFP
jgi:hypothetical protein